MFDALWLAQAANPANPPAGPSMISMLAPLAVMFLLYVFMIQRPQRRERQALLENLKKNDRVLTTSGIFGVVTNIQPEVGEVTVRVDESNNTRLRLTISSIAKIISEEPKEAAADSNK